MGAGIGVDTVTDLDAGTETTLKNGFGKVSRGALPKDYYYGRRFQHTYGYGQGHGCGDRYGYSYGSGNGEGHAPDEWIW